MTETPPPYDPRQAGATLQFMLMDRSACNPVAAGLERRPTIRATWQVWRCLVDQIDPLHPEWTAMLRSCPLLGDGGTAERWVVFLQALMESPDVAWRCRPWVDASEAGGAGRDSPGSSDPGTDGRSGGSTGRAC